MAGTAGPHEVTILQAPATERRRWWPSPRGVTYARPVGLVGRSRECSLIDEVLTDRTSCVLWIPVTSTFTMVRWWARGDLNPHILADTGT